MSACTLVVHSDVDPPTSQQMIELKQLLEKGNPDVKREAVKTCVLLAVAGHDIPAGLLMTLIRFVMPDKDKYMKKLLLLFWEAIPKTENGSLMPEMILLCNALLQDLQHPNEYLQGCTLRFLTHLKEKELLEPLVPSVLQALEHKHTYVKRNAVLAVYKIYQRHPHLIPDAPERMYDLIVSAESDAACKRNAFLMLMECDETRAVSCLTQILDTVLQFGEVLQFAVVELIRRVCRNHPQERAKFIRAVYTLITSSSPAVSYEAAATLLTLSAAPVAVKAAAGAYIKLLTSQSDNNVKMVVLDRLSDVLKRHPKILQEQVMDILRALGSAPLEIRRKVLRISMDLVSVKNIDEVVLVLKKEISKTQAAGTQDEDGDAYRQLLIGAVHQCAVKFPEVAQNVVHVLTHFLSDPNADTALDVIRFVRDVMETYPEHRAGLLDKLISNLSDIKSSRVYRAALWIIGEFSATFKQIDAGFTGIKQVLGSAPFVQAPTEGEEEVEAEPEAAAAPVVSSRPRILADGTYATESDVGQTADTSASQTGGNSDAEQFPLRQQLLSGNFFVGSALGVTLTKMSIRMSTLADVDPLIVNVFKAEVMLLVVSMLRLGESKELPREMDEDNRERLVLSFNVLQANNQHVNQLFLQASHNSFSAMLKDRNEELSAKQAQQKEEDLGAGVQADDLLVVRQLKGTRAAGQLELEDEEDPNVLVEETETDLARQLERLIQLTGYSDPIYAEAYMDVHQYDIALHLTLINQTGDTLQNVSLELATLGDLKLVERPTQLTLGPYEEKSLSANIKVSSTEQGTIFGNLVYDVAGAAQYAADRNCVILNEIRIDIMDYIRPHECTEDEFRNWWREFEWENKVQVERKRSTNQSLQSFLQHIFKSVNMNCITPSKQLAGDSKFLAANLFARSVFGELALANVSLEEGVDGVTHGTIRIRAKTQGIAVSLGDKITASASAATDQ